MRAGKGSNGGWPVDPRALLYGWFGAGVSLVVWAALLTVWGMLAEREPSAAVLRTLALLSVALGGYFAGRRCRCRAWLNGVLTAAGFCLALTWLTGGIGEGPWLWLRALLFLSFLGMVGGIIGGLKRHTG